MTGLTSASPIVPAQPVPTPTSHPPPSAAEVARATAIIEAATRHAAALNEALAAATAAQKLADHVSQQLIADQKAKMSQHLIQLDEAAVVEASQGVHDAEAIVGARARKGGSGIDFKV